MSLLESVIGWLAPPHCLACEAEGSVLCPSCSTSEILPFGERCWQCAKASPKSRTCPSCRQPSVPRHVWITTIYEGVGRQLITVYKFEHLRVAAEPLSSLMVKTLQGMSLIAELQNLNYFVVPVPTATRRIRQRSFDQTKLLARQVGHKLNLQASDELGRIGQESQVGAARSVRLAQPVGKYFVRQPENIAKRNILLVDDVLTTGATLREITKIVRAAGASRVAALVFAKRL